MPLDNQRIMDLLSRMEQGGPFTRAPHSGQRVDEPILDALMEYYSEGDYPDELPYDMQDEIERYEQHAVDRDPAVLRDQVRMGASPPLNNETIMQMLMEITGNPDAPEMWAGGYEDELPPGMGSGMPPQGGMPQGMGQSHPTGGGMPLRDSQNPSVAGSSPMKMRDMEWDAPFFRMQEAGVDPDLLMAMLEAHHGPGVPRGQLDEAYGMADESRRMMPDMMSSTEGYPYDYDPSVLQDDLEFAGSQGAINPGAEDTLGEVLKLIFNTVMRGQMRDPGVEMERGPLAQPSLR